LPKYFAIAQILVAVALIATVLFQLHGGGLGGIFGQAESTYRTRRGVERTLFKLTLTLAVIFIALAILIVASTT
jgi:preprotein translocase subunit SecG